VSVEDHAVKASATEFAPAVVIGKPVTARLPQDHAMAVSCHCKKQGLTGVGEIAHGAPQGQNDALSVSGSPTGCALAPCCVSCNDLGPVRFGLHVADPLVILFIEPLL